MVLELCMFGREQGRDIFLSKCGREQGRAIFLSMFDREWGRAILLPMFWLVKKDVITIRGGNVILSLSNEDLVVLRRWRAEVRLLFIAERGEEAAVRIVMNHIRALLVHHVIVVLMLNDLDSHCREVVKVEA